MWGNPTQVGGNQSIPAGQLRPAYFSLPLLAFLGNRYHYWIHSMSFSHFSLFFPFPLGPFLALWAPIFRHLVFSTPAVALRTRAPKPRAAFGRKPRPRSSTTPSSPPPAAAASAAAGRGPQGRRLRRRLRRRLTRRWRRGVAWRGGKSHASGACFCFWRWVVPPPETKMEERHLFLPFLALGGSPKQANKKGGFFVEPKRPFGGLGCFFQFSMLFAVGSKTPFKTILH